MIGRTLGHYRVLAEAGRGGMGEVYLAKDTRLGRKVALKILPAEAAADPERVNRFRREARALAALNHPGIVTIHSVDEAEGIPFLTMELVEGGTLAGRIPPGGLPPRDLVDLALELSDALAAAHEQGVIHRDLKPANVMITRSGRVKILDFGLARRDRVDPDAGQSGVETVAATREGMVLGTLAYMAPEQLQGHAATTASDLFALGVLLHEAATGRHPFEGTTGPEIVSAILRDQAPDPSTLREDLDPRFLDLLRRCLEKRPALRPESAREVHRRVAALVAETAAASVSASASASAPAAPSPAARDAVAVVNFENLTRDPEADWLSTGIAETMTSDLRKIASLSVLSRDRVVQTHARAAPAAMPLAELGRSLGARWVVSGSFQKLGPAVRITATTLDVATGTVLETAKVDGTMDQIFALQDRVVHALLEGFRIGPSDTEKLKLEKPQTLDLEAYEYYAKGRMRVFRMGPENMVQAEDFFRKAVARDPGYALAHSGLGQVFAMRFINSTDPRDLRTASGHLSRAAGLDPELADPHVWLAYAHARLGENEAALAAGERAVALEPENPTGWYMMGVACLLASYDEPDAGHLLRAEEAFLETRALAPRYTFTHGNLADVLLRQGRLDEARVVLAEAVAIEDSGEYELARFVGSQALLAEVELRAGRLDEAARWIEEALPALEGAAHVYRDQLRAFTRACRGELALRQQRLDEALDDFREALGLCDAHPRFLGMGRVRARARIGLARTLLRLGMRREAREEASGIQGFLADPEGWDMHWMWGTGDPVLFEQLAGTFALLGDREAAWAALERAYERGLCDAAWLETEPALAPLRGDSRFEELRRNVLARAGAVNDRRPAGN